MNNCKYCGQELQPNWIVCPHCRTRVFDERIKLNDTLYATPNEDSDKNKSGILLIVGIPLFLFSLIMLISNLYWMSYQLSQYGNTGLFNITVALTGGLLIISVIIIILGIYLKIKNIRTSARL